MYTGNARLAASRPLIPSLRAWLALLMVLISGLGLGCHEAEDARPPRAEKGILSLQTWQLESHAPISLEGAWAMAWGELRRPEDMKEGSRDLQYVKVPSYWTDYTLANGKPPGKGVATYRLTIRLGQNPADRLYSLRLPSVDSAYKLYIDGELAVEVGEVGTSLETERPRYRTIQHTFMPKGKQVELVAQVSNFHHRRGGIWQGLVLGTEPQVQRQREQALFSDFVLFGCLMMMGAYHLGLFVLRREDRSTLVFGMFCALIGTRPLVTGELWLASLWPSLDWGLLIKIEYLAYYLAVPLFFRFLSLLFPREIHPIFSRAAILFALASALVVLLTPVRIFSWTIIPFQLYTLVAGAYVMVALARAARAKRSGSSLVLGGSLFLFVTTVNDILYANGAIHTSYLVPFGLLAFIFSQSFILSMLFANAYKATQILSQHLQLTNRAYSRFVPSDFLRLLRRDDITQVQLGDQIRISMSILFSDIRDFTTLSESMSAEENFTFLNTYLRRLGPVIRRNDGFIDKYMGDGIMALFAGLPDHAVNAAVEMQREIGAFNTERVAAGKAPIRAGIGIHTGHLMLGTVGESDRMDATVISDVVNLASRLEGLTKRFGAPILLSGETFQQLQAPNRFKHRGLGQVQVKGKTRPVAIFEVLDGGQEEVVALRMRARDAFERGLEAYLRQAPEEAIRRFQEAQSIDPHDLACQYYLVRAQEQLARGTTEDWAGVEVMQEK